MGVNEAKNSIKNNKTALGIEFGSTRIKAVLVDENNMPIASGSYDWENRLENGIWTYHLEDIHAGLQGSYRALAENVKEQYGEELISVGALGVSAMMHGYMPFNKDGELLVPFRTWRNNITGQASEELMELFQYNVPQRWSIAHLYQAILNKEEHVKDIDYMTTLEAYIHWKLTGKRIQGIGDAAGMFPVDSETKDYNEEMVQKFDKLVGHMASRGSFAILCLRSWWQDRTQAVLQRKAQDFWILPESFRPEFPCVLLRVMREQEWLPQTA